MGLRVLGLKEESTYGVAATAPDWHQQISKGSASLGDEPIVKRGGSRMIRRARAGVMKPESSFEADVDMKRIGHYFKAFLDNYEFTDGGAETNKHEFWGGENTMLSSFTQWATFDFFEKIIVGAILSSLKLEVSDEFMSLANEWVYKTETSQPINADEYEQKMIDGDMPVMFYDVSLKLNDEVPPGVVSSFSFEGKNNPNVDKTIGLGSRAPQRKPAAQAREISLSLTSTLAPETLALIQAAEYGSIGEGPSECKLYKLPLELNVSICEDRTDSLKLVFPDCIVAVEYESSEADEIEVTFNLQTCATKKVKLLDDTEVVTDMYVLLENDQVEIGSNVSTNTSTVNLTVKKGEVAEEGVIIKLKDRIKGTEFTSTATITGGTTSISNVPFGRYDITATKADTELVLDSSKIISINNASETFEVKIKE